MKVLHITNNYPTKKYPIFGIFVKEQIESLSAQGVENEVFFINGREKGKFEYLISILRLRKFLHKKKYDIIHCHHSLSALCYILSGQIRGKKSIVSYQNDPSNELGKWLFKFLIIYFNSIILKNNSSIVDNNKIFYQPNGVNTKYFIPLDKYDCYTKLNLNPYKNYLLFVSSNYLRKQKRYDRFQEVLTILRRNYGMENIEGLKLINTSRELVPYYFNASNVHLLCSDFEGSPNSVKEAMACNISVVSTNVGNVSDLLSGVKGSYVAKTKNAEELAELVFKTLTNSIPNNGRKILIEKQIDMISVAKNIISIYKKVINE